jgi:hypothetical protein
MQNVLRELPKRVIIKHVRIGLNAWGGLVRDKARQDVPEETGLLGKALAVKVTIPDASRNAAHHGKPARVIVGASRKVQRAVGRIGSRKRALTAKRINRLQAAGASIRVRKPSRYAHFAEKHKPFIAPAQRAGETAGMEKLRQKLDQGLTIEAATLAIKNAPTVT